MIDIRDHGGAFGGGNPKLKYGVSDLIPYEKLVNNSLDEYNGIEINKIRIANSSGGYGSVTYGDRGELIAFAHGNTVTFHRIKPTVYQLGHVTLPEYGRYIIEYGDYLICMGQGMIHRIHKTTRSVVSKSMIQSSAYFDKPVIDNVGNLYVANATNEVAKIRISDMSIIWENATTAPNVGRLFYHEPSGRLFGNQGGLFIEINTSNGSIMRKTGTTGLTTIQALIIDSDVEVPKYLYMIAQGYTRKLDLDSTGNIKSIVWDFPRYDTAYDLVEGPDKSIWTFVSSGQALAIKIDKSGSKILEFRGESSYYPTYGSCIDEVNGILNFATTSSNELIPAYHKILE